MKKIKINELKNHKILIISERNGIVWIEKFNKRDKKEILNHLSYQLGLMDCFNPQYAGYTNTLNLS